VAIVTGGGGGIGASTCQALGAAGASVAVVGRSRAPVQAVAEALGAIGTPAIGLALDVRLERDMAAMAGATLDAFGRIDILVACAGVARAGRDGRLIPDPVAQTPLDDWSVIVGTNLTGVFLADRAVLPAMMAQGSGTIINIASSPAGLRGQPFAAAYCAAKFGVVGLSSALAEEVRGYGIRVLALHPDATETPLLGGAPWMRNSTLGAALGSPVPPARIAGLITLLASMPGDCVIDGAIIGPSHVGVS
jgi:NAD(P)-dependent dehydrogenase (short-subunit alcohol dehydrogenase family)